MSEREGVAGQFEEHRKYLRDVAYRILGSVSDADDAVQEAWLRIRRAEDADVLNLRAWLTTVVARISLNMLRARTARREALIDTDELSRTSRALRRTASRKQCSPIRSDLRCSSFSSG